ncbi:MAG TPA: hypothetical protein VHE56_11180 [Mycobacteriales bacterium]|nr:hypothetical protein [Mycobacteriales bacterium]
MSPVIILGLVLMWAVVLVPMWLRRHDEVEETRSVDRFTAAMHTLSRYDDTQRDAMRSHHSRPLDVHVSGASAPDAIAARRRRGMAHRRARSLGVLVATDFAIFLGAIVSGAMLLWVLQIMLDLAVVAFVVHLRRMATMAAAARRRAARQQRDRRELDAALAEPEYDQRPWQEGVTIRRPAATVEPVYAGGGARQMPADAVFDQTALSDDDQLAPAYASAVEPMSVRVSANDGFFDQEIDLTAAEREPSFIEAGAVRAERPAAQREERPAVRREERPAAQLEEPVGGSEWEPRPVPRPTYAMKPAAPPRPQRRRVSEPILPPVEPAAELDTDDDLEAILDRRWAVND